MGLKMRIFLLDYYLALILIGCHLWSSSICEDTPGYNLYTSPSVTVQRGLCLHVPCWFTVPSDKQLSINTTGLWYRFYNGSLYSIAIKNISTYWTEGIFFLTGNLASRDCSYSLEDPDPTYEGTYYFRFEDGSLKFTYQDTHPHVHVTELTDKPSISSTRLVDGEEVTLTCTSPGRCRNIRSQITWEGTMTGIRQKMYNITYEDGSRTFHSNITFTPRKSHNNSTLSCKVTFKSNLSTVETRTLNVEYSPSLKITMEGDDTDDITAVDVKDGDSITMKCIVDSNPKASITWYKEDMAVHRTISDRTVTLALINITQGDAGRYRCTAENEHGAAHRTVEITYHSTQSQFSSAMAAAVGGILFLVLIIVIGAFLIKKMRKQRSKNINGDKKNNINPPEESDHQSSHGDNLVYMVAGDVQYASVEFSKVKPKEVILDNTETVYSEVKKTCDN